MTFRGEKEQPRLERRLCWKENEEEKEEEDEEQPLFDERRRAPKNTPCAEGFATTGCMCERGFANWRITERDVKNGGFGVRADEKRTIKDRSKVSESFSVKCASSSERCVVL